MSGACGRRVGVWGLGWGGSGLERGLGRLCEGCAGFMYILVACLYSESVWDIYAISSYVRFFTLLSR